jgi:hypothetical protein
MVESMDMYRQIVRYSAVNGIPLDEGYRVWAGDADTVIPSAHERTGQFKFPTSDEARVLGERHNRKSRVIISGPNGQHFEIPSSRRRP